MSNIHDLRVAHEEQAERLDDTERYIRPAAVRERIRVIRRRRATGTAVAAAVLLMSAVAGISTLHTASTPEPAGPTVVGIDVPDEVAVLGFPYGIAGTESMPSGTPATVDGEGTDQAVLLVGD